MTPNGRRDMLPSLKFQDCAHSSGPLDCDISPFDFMINFRSQTFKCHDQHGACD